MKQAVFDKEAPAARPKTARRVTATRKRATSYQGILQSLPSELTSKLTFDRSTYAKSYSIQKWLMVYGLSVLDRQEFSVLYFIAARTIIFGKKAEMITKEHYMRGVWSNEELVCSPCCITEKYLYRSIRSLEELGFIKVIPLKFRGRKLPTIYEIEIDFILNYKPSEDIMSKLRLPKGLKSADIVDLEAYRLEKQQKLIGVRQHHGSTISMVLPNTINNINTKNEIKECLVATHSLRNENRKRRSPRPKNEIDCKSKIREVINVTTARTTLKQEEKVRRGRRVGIMNIALQDLNATWKRCMVDKFGSCTVAGLTHKEFGMFKRIMKTHELSCSWYDFATWAVTNWSRLNKESKEAADYYKKKDGDWSLKEEDRVLLGTDYPDLFMLVKNYGKLVKRYAQDTMRNKSIDTEQQLRKENEALKEKLKHTSYEAASAKATLQRVTRQRPGAAKTEKRQTTVVNPDSDTFFKDADSSLPDWR